MRITVLDDATGLPTPARIHLLDASAKSHRPPNYPSWHDHFVCDGTAVVQLANGACTCTVERGPEFESASLALAVNGQDQTITVRLKRIANLASEGWFSGETHMHRRLEDVPLLMQAEDLRVAQVITWWNKTNPWKETAPPEPAVRRFDGGRFYHAVSGEDERDGGALLYCDLDRPLEITAGAQHFPSSLVYAKQARERGAQWLDAEKPFWWDFPMWVAHGMANTVGIANNHMNRGGMYENEAWGRPRDRSQFPAPLGNALWTQEIYYHALNCGLKLPPSAGSASGVLPNPVGYNRAYVHVEGALTYEKWREGLLAGRSFVSNGPLLRCRVNGKLPGHLFSSDAPIELSLDGQLDSRDPIKVVELVRNGWVERIELPARIRFTQSGWFLVRAIADVTNTFRFASTAPWYVEIGGTPRISATSARFFVDWCRERMEALAARPELNAAQKEQVLEPWRTADRFWKEKLALADRAEAQKPLFIPDKLVVLTFDDSVASHYEVVRPILKKYGFGATFFITEGFSFPTNKKDYMTWEQIAELHRDGFEIGNHTRDHLGVNAGNLHQLKEQLEAINQRCAEHAIPRPISFAYPGNAIHPGAVPILKELGIQLARRGTEPELPYKEGRGIGFRPGLDHPLLIPTAGDARPDWTLENLKRAAGLARQGRIAVLQFHGVPDNEHPWVHTPPERFAEYMEWLHAEKYHVIAMRDLKRYVEETVPADPWAMIDNRKAALNRGEPID